MQTILYARSASKIFKTRCDVWGLLALMDNFLILGGLCDVNHMETGCSENNCCTMGLWPGTVKRRITMNFAIRAALVTYSRRCCSFLSKRTFPNVSLPYPSLSVPSVLQVTVASKNNYASCARCSNSRSVGCTPTLQSLQMADWPRRRWNHSD